jgi:hypothetical protein
VSIYRRADRATAWFQDDFAGATMTPNCGVIHTTEGTTLPGYASGATAPNYTAVPDFQEKRLRWYAHFPDERSSRALVNLAGGVETNTANAIQVELVGTCSETTRAAWRRAGVAFIYWPHPPVWALREVARFLVDMNARHGIPLTGPKDDRWVAYPESYGPGGQRFTFDEWRKFTGWCGHQHVPENVHGDPGDFPFSQLIEMAQGIADSGEPATPRWDHLARVARAISEDAPHGSVRAKDATRILDIAEKHSTKY